MIISIPETTTLAAASVIRKEAMEAFKRPVMIVTHNIEFVKVEKLSTAEATTVLREIDELTHPKPEQPKPAEVVPIQSAEQPPAPVDVKLDATSPDGVQK